MNILRTLAIASALTLGLGQVAFAGTVQPIQVADQSMHTMSSRHMMMAKKHQMVQHKKMAKKRAMMSHKKAMIQHHGR